METQLDEEEVDGGTATPWPLAYLQIVLAWDLPSAPTPTPGVAPSRRAPPPTSASVIECRVHYLEPLEDGPDGLAPPTPRPRLSFQASTGHASTQGLPIGLPPGLEAGCCVRCGPECAPPKPPPNVAPPSTPPPAPLPAGGMYVAAGQWRGSVRDGGRGALRLQWSSSANPNAPTVTTVMTVDLLPQPTLFHFALAYRPDEASALRDRLLTQWAGAARPGRALRVWDACSPPPLPTPPPTPPPNAGRGASPSPASAPGAGGSGSRNGSGGGGSGGGAPTPTAFSSAAAAATAAAIVSIDMEMAGRTPSGTHGPLGKLSVTPSGHLTPCGTPKAPPSPRGPRRPMGLAGASSVGRKSIKGKSMMDMAFIGGGGLSLSLGDGGVAATVAAAANLLVLLSPNVWTSVEVLTALRQALAAKRPVLLMYVPAADAETAAAVGAAAVAAVAGGEAAAAAGGGRGLSAMPAPELLALAPGVAVDLAAIVAGVPPDLARLFEEVAPVPYRLHPYAEAAALRHVVQMGGCGSRMAKPEEAGVLEAYLAPQLDRVDLSTLRPHRPPAPASGSGSGTPPPPAFYYEGVALRRHRANHACSPPLLRGWYQAEVVFDAAASQVHMDVSYEPKISNSMPSYRHRISLKWTAAEDNAAAASAAAAAFAAVSGFPCDGPDGSVRGGSAYPIYASTSAAPGASAIAAAAAAAAASGGSAALEYAAKEAGAAAAAAPPKGLADVEGCVVQLGEAKQGSYWGRWEGSVQGLGGEFQLIEADDTLVLRAQTFFHHFYLASPSDGASGLASLLASGLRNQSTPGCRVRLYDSVHGSGGAAVARPAAERAAALDCSAAVLAVLSPNAWSDAAFVQDLEKAAELDLPVIFLYDPDPKSPAFVDLEAVLRAAPQGAVASYIAKALDVVPLFRRWYEQSACMEQLMRAAGFGRCVRLPTDDDSFAEELREARNELGGLAVLRDRRWAYYEGTAGRGGNVWGWYQVEAKFQPELELVELWVEFESKNPGSVPSYKARFSLDWRRADNTVREREGRWSGRVGGIGGPFTLRNRFGDDLLFNPQPHIWHYCLSGLQGESAEACAALAAALPELSEQGRRMRVWYDDRSSALSREALELGVSNSQHFTLFLSPGTFASVYARFEIQTALRLNKSTIVIHDPDSASKMHVDIKAARASAPAELRPLFDGPCLAWPGLRPDAVEGFVKQILEVGGFGRLYRSRKQQALEAAKAAAAGAGL
ncbi:hypothetical protein HYH03_001903 [Edaphochlamys debaryana]|uniref:TIR domain-containing protein n=1 Tax=Edaphochlamys debaryana TaxID=47281 RepID=A0A835YCB7_9CHLO|nr:hypothetical protein HYH03_001903 [Edaphochlamys debaryana]|eukprot:KAG2500327.1 hypothetical protein HYH03_001903 [Edaphochlamys debaryana]